MKSIIAIAVALSLSACGSMQTNADGSVTATNIDGSVCTYVGFHKTCKSAIEVSMDKDDQDMAAYAAKARQQRQEEAAATEKVQQAALAEAETKAEADRAAAEAFAKTPEGIAQAAAREASQKEAAANDAARHIVTYKKMMVDLRAQQQRERMVEEESGGVMDMSERYRVANDIVGLKEWLAEAWKTYKANGGKAKSIDDIS
jgi:type IV secretory pathway VirB10-like protein